MQRNSMTRTLLVLSLVTSMVLAGCDGGDDDQAQGTSTIQGNVTSFGANVVAGVLPVITVSLQGTDHVTTTAADGSFTITGVSVGDFVLVFSFGETTATYPVAVTLNVTITLANVAIAIDGTVAVDSEDVAANDPPPADPPAAGPTTAEQMAGTWRGQGSGPTGETGLMTITLVSADGVSISGTWSYDGHGGPISGTPVNGRVSFSLPNTDPHPDCNSFSVQASITLSGSTLTFHASGDFCGPNSSINATLTK